MSFMDKMLLVEHAWTLPAHTYIARMNRITKNRQEIYSKYLILIAKLKKQNIFFDIPIYFILNKIIADECCDLIH